MMKILLVNPGRRDYVVNFFLDICPKVTNKKKFKFFLRKFILKKKINVVFPISEWELEILAKEKSFYEKKNVKIIISNLSLIRTCKNKILMSKTLLQNKLKALLKNQMELVFQIREEEFH